MPGEREILRLINIRTKKLAIFERILEKVHIISLKDGNCTAEFVVAEEMESVNKLLHGGFSAVAVDTITTFALMAYGNNNPGVTVDLHVKYIKPAYHGETILVNANIIQVGKTIAHVGATLINKKTSELIVTGTHTKYMGPK